MDTMQTVAKALAGGVVSFLANWTATTFGLDIPEDVKLAGAALVVALVVWLVPNKPAAPAAGARK